MSNIRLQNEQWSKIAEFLDRHPKVYVGNKKECRRCLEGVLWMMRSGAQWRLLPADYGKWNSVYKRFSRWWDEGVWQQMHEYFADDPDMENLLFDSTTVRAHPCAAGAPAKKGGKQPKH
jgi:transposase